MSKQEKARIQNPIAIPEPTNEVSALWRTCQALKEAVEVLQGERGNREAALKVDVNELRDELINGNVVVGNVAPGGATTTLFALTDTTLDTQIQGSFLYNQNGTQWYPSINALWDDTNQQFKLDLDSVIQWLDTSQAQYVTGAAFEEATGAGGTPDPDPNLGNVSVLVTAESGTVNAGTFTSDIGDITWTYTNGDPTSGAEQGYVTDVSAYTGSKSIFCKGETGATFEGFVGPAQNSAEALVFFPTGLQEFTYEFWIDPSTEYTGLNPDGRWNNGFPVLSSYNDQNLSAQALEIECDKTGRLNFVIPIATGRSAVLSQISTGESWDSSGWVQESWHHWAIVRESDGEFRAYFDGVLRATTTGSSATQIVQPTNSQTVNFGCNQRNGQLPNGQGCAAYVDDLRLTKGVARYVQGVATVGQQVFTPPTKPFEGTLFTKNFVFGDPAYNTRIDGLQTTVSNNALFKSTYPDEEISPLWLVDSFDVSRPAGYGTMAGITVSNTTLDAATNVWHTRVVCDGTCTITVNSTTHTNVPDGAFFWVYSTTGVTTISGTGTFSVDKFLGSGVVTGNASVAAGGWALVVKHSSTKLHVTGVGVS